MGFNSKSKKVMDISNVVQALAIANLELGAVRILNAMLLSEAPTQTKRRGQKRIIKLQKAKRR